MRSAWLTGSLPTRALARVEATVLRLLAVDEGDEDLLERLGLFPGEVLAGTEVPQQVVVLRA